MLEAGSTQRYELLYSVWGQLAQVGEIQNATAGGEAIAWLLRYLQTRNNWIFVWYRLAFGATILVALATGLLKNT